MNILVTGGTGFLGRHLVPHLEKSGAKVVIINTKNCDLTEKSNLLKFKDQKFDRIYHLAAWTKAGDFCLKHKGEQWLINQQINTNVLWYWKEFQRESTMIAMGTICAYSPLLESFVEEDFMKGEVDDNFYSYAMSKRMLYSGLKSLNSQFDMKFNYLIPNAIYGPNFDSNDSHFIFDLIKKIVIGKKQNKEVELWGTGEQRRELTYVKDVINLIDLAIDKYSNNILNINEGVDYSIRQYAKMICEIIGYDDRQILYNTNKFTGMNKKSLSSEKINQLFKFSFTPIDDGLKNTINYYLSTI